MSLQKLRQIVESEDTDREAKAEALGQLRNDFTDLLTLPDMLAVDIAKYTLDCGSDLSHFRLIKKVFDHVQYKYSHGEVAYKIVGDRIPKGEAKEEGFATPDEVVEGVRDYHRNDYSFWLEMERQPNNPSILLGQIPIVKEEVKGKNCPSQLILFLEDTLELLDEISCISIEDRSSILDTPVVSKSIKEI